MTTRRRRKPSRGEQQLEAYAALLWIVLHADYVAAEIRRMGDRFAEILRALQSEEGKSET